MILICFCGIYTSGYYYACTTCKNSRCDISCDTTCLPSTITHEGYNHPLVQTLVSAGDVAKHVEMQFLGMKYKCDTCNFHLDHHCAVLPEIVRHEWDQHPVSLTYSPFNHPNDYFCEICEEDIHPSY